MKKGGAPMKNLRTRAKPKSTRKPLTKTPALTQGECIRVVPLHSPKPSLPISDVARQRTAEESDFFGDRPAPPPAPVQLTYRGGPLLQNPEVFTIFWGETWGTTPSSTARRYTRAPAALDEK